MATLNITEFERLADDARPKSGQGNAIPVGQLPEVAVQSLTYTTTAQSAALNTKTRIVRLIADADAYIAVGKNPVATTANMRLEADQAEYFGIEGKSGDILIAAYDGSS